MLLRLTLLTHCIAACHFAQVPSLSHSLPKHRILLVMSAPVAAAAAASSAVVAAEVAAALLKVRESIASACALHGVSRPPLLVAVSKTKPAEAVAYAYAGGARVFGENYVAELCDKASHPLLSPAAAPGIRWHFIGHLQSNKCRQLCARTPGLAMVESVDSAKLATELNKAWAAVVKADQTAAPANKSAAASTAAAASSSSVSSAASAAASAPARPARLPILIQINSSGEDSKFGCAPSEAVGLFGHVLASCPALEARGLMTIGSPLAYDATKARECLKIMRRIKDEVLHKFAPGAQQQVADAPAAAASASGSGSAPCGVLSVDASSFELSMGMSSDFADAIAEGSTEVRVGSSIFGAREYASKTASAAAAEAEAPAQSASTNKVAEAEKQ